MLISESASVWPAGVRRWHYNSRLAFTHYMLMIGMNGNIYVCVCYGGTKPEFEAGVYRFL